MALVVPDDGASFEHPFDGTIQPYNPMFDFIRNIRLDCCIDGCLDTFAIVWVDGIDEILIGGFEPTIRVTKQGRNPLSPMQTSGNNIPIPGADIGIVLSPPQTLFSLTSATAFSPSHVQRSVDLRAF